MTPEEQDRADQAAAMASAADAAAMALVRVSDSAVWSLAYYSRSGSEVHLELVTDNWGPAVVVTVDVRAGLTR